MVMLRLPSGENIRLKPGDRYEDENIKLVLQEIRPGVRGKYRGTLLSARRAFENLSGDFYYREYGLSRRLFDIGFYHRDPYLAKRVVEEMYRGYVELRQRGFEEETKTRLRFIDEELERVREELFRRLDELVQFQKGIQPEILTPEGQEIYRRLIALQTSKEDLELSISRIKKLLSSFRAEDVGDYLLFMSGNRQALAKLAEQYTNLSARKRQLLVDLTEEHPSVVSVQEQLDELSEKIRKNVENELESLEKTLADTNSLLREYQQRAQEIPELRSRYSQLMQRIDILKSIYQILINKRTEAELELKGFAPTFQVVSPPEIPALPTRPRLRNVVLVGLVAGLAFQLLVELLLIVVFGVAVSSTQVREALSIPALRLTRQRVAVVAQRLRRLLGEGGKGLLLVHPYARSYGLADRLERVREVRGTLLDQVEEIEGAQLVLVVPWGKLTLEELAEQHKLVEELGGSLLAVVLTDPLRRWW